MSMSHITIKLRGQEPRPHRCHADATLFTCPFCSTDVCKPRQYHQIMAHIAGHKLRAVEYGDHVIYSCNIGCGKAARHFHCCQCPKTYINKGSLKKHLSNCHPIATCTLKPQPVSDPPQEPPSQTPASHPQQEPPSPQPASQPPQEPPSQQPASHPQQEPPSQQPASHPQQEPPSPQPASHPQQEPPSQQPASHPPQEPPSPQPASHPQQEPPSQQPASHPQQEPPSQQPASHPQQEPPSQQPASHPQQEPPSQQPASHPQQEPPSQQPASHPQQEPPSPQPASHPQQEPPSQQPASHPQQEPPSQHPASHPQQEPPSPQPASHPQQEPSSQHPASHPQQEPPSQQPASHPQQEPPSPQPASHPQQEPSSQQPASHPQKEPPSQQPASQPPQEPSSQKAASHPLQLAASPAIKRISLQCRRRHITIKLRGQEPRPHRCHADATLFTCPFCSTDVCKPRQYHQIMAHIAGHKLRAVEYGDHVIYSCNIGCGKMAKHFHCFQCPKTYINKSALKKHLCNSHPIASCTLKQPASDPLQEPPSQQPACPPQKESPSQQPSSDPLQLAAPPAIKSHRRHITIKLRGQEPRPHRCHADATLFTCPFCSTDVCKPRQYHQIMAHIAGHKLRAVEYGDHVIYSCNIGCGKMARHFHCCQCPKTYINKADLKKHLCCSHPIATCTLKPQPVSDPPQDPPSQKPASQPQQEPHLQQPASPPLQLAAPPVIKRRQISVQCHHRHITIKQRGQEPQPQRCHADATLFTCPFCTTDACKPRKYHQIMAHIAGHKLSAVEYGDDVIYSCNSCGEKARHFHCCQCPQTYFNQGALKRHLCNTHPIATCTPEPQPVGRPLQEPTFQQPAPCPLELAAQRVIVKRKQISVQCPHCRVNLNSKNLKMHIKRKHHESMHQSQSQAITPTWDSSHKVICDIDICKSCETAPRSELLVTQCVSLSSVDYSCAAEPSEDLSEDMLTEME